MSMSRPVTTLFLSALLLLACGSARAAVEGVRADAANEQEGFAAAHLVDGDLATAWVGGGKGVGPGKWIELTFPGPVRVEGLSVATGNQARGRFNAFRRMTGGVIIFPDETRVKFSLKSAPGEQRVPLEPRLARSIRIIITAVAPAARDAALGEDAKVAVSEIRVLGVPEAAPEGETGAGPAVPEPGGKTAKPAPEAGTEPVSQPPSALSSAPAAAPASAPEPEAKPAPAPKVVPAPAPKAVPAPKAAPAPACNPEAASPVKPEPKPAPGKAAPKKAAAGAAVAVGGVAARMRPAVVISPDQPLDVGDISPWLDLELVAQIKRYLGLLTTLHDSYPDLFAPAVRERERAAFLALQESMRADGRFADHHIAMLEHIGLGFDRPTEAGGRITVRVHGPYRYYVGDQAWEFTVDANVTLVREQDKWLILDVKDN
ncbi:MAG: hypothetical protein V3571_09970 [Pseudodesulfovibrio sp.]